VANCKIKYSGGARCVRRAGPSGFCQVHSSPTHRAALAKVLRRPLSSASAAGDFLVQRRTPGDVWITQGRAETREGAEELLADLGGDDHDDKERPWRIVDANETSAAPSDAEVEALASRAERWAASPLVDGDAGDALAECAAALRSFLQERRYGVERYGFGKESKP